MSGTKIMRRICAWCKKDMDGNVETLNQSVMITHTICPECYDGQIKQLEEPVRLTNSRKAYLNSDEVMKVVAARVLEDIKKTP